MATLRTILASISALVGMVLAIPVVIIAIPFWTVAFLTRQCSRLFVPQAKSWENIVEFDELVGWKPKPNLNAYCSFAGGVFRVKTDSQGWRGEKDLSQCDILILGDSFAFGFGVNDEHAFFSMAKPQLRIKAVGCPGYNMVQEIIWLERLSPYLKGKLVVWFICLSNDLYDNLIPNLYHYRMPFVRESTGNSTWEIVTNHIKPSQWPFNPENNSRVKEKWDATFADNFLGQRAYSACEFLLGKGKEICMRAGARPIVLTVPWMHQLDERDWERSLSQVANGEVMSRHLPDRKIREICLKLRLPFVSGKDHLNTADHIPREGHWNKRGHQRVVQLLVKLYREHVVRNGTNFGFGIIRTAGNQ